MSRCEVETSSGWFFLGEGYLRHRSLSPSGSAFIFRGLLLLNAAHGERTSPPRQRIHVEDAYARPTLACNNEALPIAREPDCPRKSARVGPFDDAFKTKRIPQNQLSVAVGGRQPLTRWIEPKRCDV